MAFTNIQAGDPILASSVMANFKHVNYGAALIPVNASGTGVDNTLSHGTSTYRWATVYATNLIGLIGLSSAGVSGGSGVSQAAIPILSGAALAEIWVVGDSYNGVSGTHNGYWHGIWRSSSNEITTMTDMNNLTGANQGFIVSYSAGYINVINKGTMTANQSAKTRIVFM